MIKGYWVALVDIEDPEAYKAYVTANVVACGKYGARILTQGAKSEVVDGRLRSRVVVIEFKDFETALACYQSPEREEVMAQIQGISPDIRVVEGYDAQP